MKTIIQLFFIIITSVSLAQKTNSIEATSFTQAVEKGLIESVSINNTRVKESTITSTNDIITYFPNRNSLTTACTGTLILEDFAGGPQNVSNTGCDGDFSVAGNSCFSAGEIQAGIIVTSSDTSASDYMAFTAAGFASNTVDVVGTNQFPSYTILEFTDGMTNTVALDFYSLPFGGTVEARVFGVDSGLLDTVSITDLPGPVFFGFISSEAILKIEFQDTGSFVEMVGQVEFGSCEATNSIENITREKIEYYPNPINDNLTIKAAHTIKFISITNVLGQQIKHSTPFANSITIDVSNLDKGTYFVKTQISNKIEVFKIIKK